MEAILLQMIDGMLSETGSQSLLDADKVRDWLLDLRNFVTTPAPKEEVPCTTSQ